MARYTLLVDYFQVVRVFLLFSFLWNLSPNTSLRNTFYLQIVQSEFFDITRIIKKFIKKLIT